MLGTVTLAIYRGEEIRAVLQSFGFPVLRPVSFGGISYEVEGVLRTPNYSFKVHVLIYHPPFANHPQVQRPFLRSASEAGLEVYARCMNAFHVSVYNVIPGTLQLIFGWVVTVAQVGGALSCYWDM